MFDETYDEVEDIKVRSKLLIRNVENIINGEKDKILGSQYIKDKCVYNRNIFFENKGKQKWLDVIKWLETTHAL